MMISDSEWVEHCQRAFKAGYMIGRFHGWLYGLAFGLVAFILSRLAA